MSTPASEAIAHASVGEAITNAYATELMRRPKTSEVQHWESVIAASEMTAQGLSEAFRGSEEAVKLRRKRRGQAWELCKSVGALIVFLGMAYVVTVRRCPERKVVFILFALLVTPVFMDYDLVYEKAHFLDLPSFYYGADYVYNQHRSPYGNILQDELGGKIFPFFHPPPCLIAFYPLSLMSLDVAKEVVTFGSQVALLLVLYFLIIRGRAGENVVIPLGLTVYMLSFYPNWLTFVYGQPNFWTTLFICVFMEAYVRKRSGAWVGLPLAAAIIMKIYPGLLLGYLLLKRKWSAIAWCFAALGVATVIGLVTVPWEIWESWWACVGSRSSYGAVGPVGLFSPAGPWNQGLNGICLRLLTVNSFTFGITDDPKLSKLVTYLLSASVLFGATFLLWLRNRRDCREDEELEMGLLLVVMTVVVPLSWLHHSVMLLPAIAAGARHAFKHRRPLIVALFLVSAMLLAWDLSALPVQLRLLKGGMSLLLGSAAGFARLGLVISIGAMLIEPWRTPPASKPASAS
ncbi:MAG: glycosyltransferase family 87 protein [Verrucomicrobia bacterium]|nr:glycosyltransferase family 87 protein [Verrucomicrobiota bacterium]